MGGSILAAWIKKGYPLKNIYVVEPNPSVWLKKKSDEGLNLNVLQPLLSNRPYLFSNII